MSGRMKTDIIEVSATIPKLVVEDRDHISFDDLEIVGGLPASLNVVGISDIVVYNNPTEDVVGIETIYRLDDDRLSTPVLHGTRTKHLTRIRVASHERIIAAFVGVTDGKPIRALRFTKTNRKTGEVRTEGYVSGDATVGVSNTYNAAFGEIVAFQGIKSRGTQGSLIALGVQLRFLESH